MEKKEVTLSKIIDGLEMVDDINDYYYNPNTNEVFGSNIGDYEDLSQEEIDNLFEESIILPTQYEINEYKMMCDFIETIDNEEIKSNFQRLINGKGAFRRFKDYCIETNVSENWYNFKDDRFREIAIEWCEENGFEYK